MTLNGQKIHAEVEPRQHLVDFLRDDQALTGSHLGCEQGACGACTVKLDGKIVRGCLVLTVQANGSTVETIEGMSASGAYKDLQQAFLKMNALQCGFCTAGIVITIESLLKEFPQATESQIQDALSGHLCRCTGYQNILKAIRKTLLPHPESN